MEKPEKVVLELKAHEVDLGFRPNGRHTLHVEDEILCNHYPVKHDAFKQLLDKLAEPGFFELKEGFFRPHSDIAYVQLKESVVTQVLTFEQFDGKWVITNEE